MKRTIPKSVHQYHTLYPLDNIAKPNTSRGGINIPTESYKAVDENGQGVVLRRIVNWEGSIDVCTIFCYLTFQGAKEQFIENWKALRHPNVVALRQVIQSNEFTGTTNGMN